MGPNEHANQALYEAIRGLVMDEKLDEQSDAYDIAMQVVESGYGSLSERQQHIYDRVELLLKPSRRRA